MLQTAIDNLIESETSMSAKIEIINEITDQIIDIDHLSNIRVKLIQQVNEIASEHDICTCGMTYEYDKRGEKRCPQCGRRSDNE